MATEKIKIEYLPENAILHDWRETTNNILTSLQYSEFEFDKEKAIEDSTHFTTSGVLYKELKPIKENIAADNNILSIDKIEGKNFINYNETQVFSDGDVIYNYKYSVLKHGLIDFTVTDFNTLKDAIDLIQNHNNIIYCVWDKDEDINVRLNIFDEETFYVVLPDLSTYYLSKTDGKIQTDFQQDFKDAFAFENTYIIKLQSKLNGSTVELKKNGSPIEESFLYSIDEKETWLDYDNSVITLNNDKNIYFKTKDANSDIKFLLSTDTDYYYFETTGSIIIKL